MSRELYVRNLDLKSSGNNTVLVSLDVSSIGSLNLTLLKRNLYLYTLPLLSFSYIKLGPFISSNTHSLIN